MRGGVCEHVATHAWRRQWVIPATRNRANKGGAADRIVFGSMPALAAGCSKRSFTIWPVPPALSELPQDQKSPGDTCE